MKILRSLVILAALAFPSLAFATNPSTTNLKIWYRADSLTCSGGCSGTNPVSSWVDKSSNTNDAGINGLASPGAYVASATNSQPGVTFSSSIHNGYDFVSAINLQTASTICAVLKTTSPGSKGVVVSGATASLAYYTGDGGTKEQGADKASIANLGHGNAASDSSFHSICMDYNGTTVHWFIDGGTDGNATPSVAITANETSIGLNSSSGGEWFDGVLCDLVIYDAVLNSSDRAQWFTYTTEHYNIPAPSGGSVCSGGLLLRGAGGC
jgi:hypothetical protein